MRNLLSAGLLTLSVLMTAPLTASAEKLMTHSVGTTNLSSNRAWITIQDLGKTRNLDYGYVEAGRHRNWESGNYLLGSYYYVRFEFKGPGDKTVCDTRAQVAIHSDFSGTVGAAVTGHYDPKTNRCYIAK
jgi:hypothetical protein